ncbi:MAG: serine/threonine protein kinase [Phycisphaeraceae bacterium]|nr:serine/threonine protein kinase [Phycisphaeraceae bacterium]
MASARAVRLAEGLRVTILSPGQLVRDTYEVERLLGEGAFAEVYRVKHRFMGRQAMKVFKATGATLEDIERDIAEALLLSGIKHPNIVEVYDANVLEAKAEQFGYFTMTYVPGGTLERYWRSFASELMPVEQVVEVMRQACRGLAVAHSSSPPIVHRDIKPQNILVGFGASGLHVRLSDFGLAKAVNPLTLLVSAKGTLGFKPPESLENVDSCAADVWAVGTTLYLLLTDEMPFPMLNERDIEDANRFLRPIRPPSIYNVGIDAGLESIIFRCLAARPADRYANANELLQDLEKWRPGFKPPGTSVSQSRRGSKSAIVERSPHDLKREANSALQEAIQIAQDPAKLMSAADLLEEAISKDPALRDRYEWQLQLWRKGIMHVSTADLRQFPKRLSRPNQSTGGNREQ